MDTPILTPTACEGTTNLFETDYFGAPGVPHAERPAVRRGRRARIREGLLLRPDLSRGEIEDPAPSDGVLDGRAGSRLLDLDGDMELAEDFVVLIVRRVLERRRAELSRSSATRPARARRVAVPAHHLRRRGRAPAGAGRRSRVGRRLRRRRGDGAVRAVRPSGVRPPIPGRVQGLLHEAGPGAPGGGARRGSAGARGLRRDHRRRPARGRLRNSAHQITAHGLPLERRSSGTWTCAATAPCPTPASAWGSSA